MTLYAAYGTNLHPALMAERAPHSPLWSTGWLQGWRLTFGGADKGPGGALVTVVQRADGDPDGPTHQGVYVGLYDLTDADAARLDSWEGADTGLYRRLRVRVDTLEGEAVAWLYVLDDYEGGLPSARYLGALADAAEAAGAPGDYVTALRSRPCLPSA